MAAGTAPTLTLTVALALALTVSRHCRARPTNPISELDRAQVQRLARARVERARGRPAADVGAAAARTRGPRRLRGRRRLHRGGQPARRPLQPYVSLNLPAALHLPKPPYISLNLPTAPYICRISLLLPISLLRSACASTSSAARSRWPTALPLPTSRRVRAPRSRVSAADTAGTKVQVQASARPPRSLRGSQGTSRAETVASACTRSAAARAPLVPTTCF